MHIIFLLIKQIRSRLSNVRNTINAHITGLVRSLQQQASTFTTGPPPSYSTALRLHRNVAVHPKEDSDERGDILPPYALAPTRESARPAEESELLTSDSYQPGMHIDIFMSLIPTAHFVTSACT